MSGRRRKVCLGGALPLFRPLGSLPHGTGKRKSEGQPAVAMSPPRRAPCAQTTRIQPFATPILPCPGFLVVRAAGGHQPDGGAKHRA